MKITMKKIVAFCLSIALIVGLTQVPVLNAQAAEGSFFVDVTKDNAPLRLGPTQDDEIVARTYEGRVLTVVRELYNHRGNLWYEVKWESELGDGRTLYIYSGNVTAHRHNYLCDYVDGISFDYCPCGSVHVQEMLEVEQMDTAVLSYTLTAAGVGSLADGPLPVADVVFGVTLVGAWALAYTGVIPKTISQVAVDVDAIEWLKSNQNVCTSTNFRMVERVASKLVVVGDKCLNAAEAFVYSRYCGGDVWTPDPSGAAAYEVAVMNGECFGSEVDRNKVGYYYHYHYGTSHDDCVGGHVFFGRGVENGCIPEGA